MDWRSFVELFKSKGRKAAEARRAILAQQRQFLLKSLSPLGFHVINGSESDLTSWGEKVVFQRGDLLLRAIVDRTMLIFDVASTCDREEWYLLSLVEAEVEQAQPSDSREPTPEEVVEFLGGGGANLPGIFFAYAVAGLSRTSSRAQPCADRLHGQVVAALGPGPVAVYLHRRGRLSLLRPRPPRSPRTQHLGGSAPLVAGVEEAGGGG